MEQLKIFYLLFLCIHTILVNFVYHIIISLINILYKLRSGGNTIVVIEHNLDVIKVADYLIDLGPEGGTGGGTVIAKGTPEQVAEVNGSYTGYFLKKILSGENT